ncbi:hypothetical protein Dtox_3918 [Desulfofarcimen acetoxidans DSM 771]|uniref:PIN like domain-containing protein n=1 Tax=Desulfofarcimen acetoxidans (strain ATCC 49208 / DSM 771 / KCTC 5769 / VKM B-1644 / 5575) TaxID=485916 RepID=C8VXY2_DESAS|nr:PIN domain-containing protein [Desulfofarcimen acetoxidans]ACV64611.1 hypothetical protein Dtox_3918 [Desulfofarcimen acetoxidans DSM 771]
MHSLFIGHIRPSEEQFKEIWNDGIFVFDTNILLNLYRYSSSTQKAFIEVLEKYQDRMWIPHQVAVEYVSNRLEVIFQQENLYNTIESIIDIPKIISQLKKYKDRHFSISIEKITSILEKTGEDISKELKESKSSDIKYSEDDIILKQIVDLFDGRIGTPYNKEKLEQLYNIAKLRYDQEIPPGYKERKSGNDKYNDYILWQQTIDYAREQKKPIIFVTDDRKDDWWLNLHGKTLGPRPELIQEMYNEAEVHCLIYRPEKFLGYDGMSQDDPTVHEIISLEEINSTVNEDINIEELNSIIQDKITIEELIDRNLLLKSAINIIEKHDICIEDIQNEINNFKLNNKNEFTTIQLVKKLNSNDYIVGDPLNMAIGRILGEAKDRLSIEPISRMNTYDDDYNATSTRIWKIIN